MDWDKYPKVIDYYITILHKGNKLSQANVMKLIQWYSIWEKRYKK